jgi:NDP-sugar pyrophosphorylase family protein
MVKFNDVPFLKYLVSWLSNQGCTDIILSIGHLSENIEDIFNTSFWKQKGVRMIKDYPVPLGTGGAIVSAARQALHPDVVTCNGDTVVEVDLNFCLNRHVILGVPMASVVTMNEGVPNQGCLLIENDLIVEFSEGQQPKQLTVGGSKYRASSTGIYLARRSFLTENCPDGPFSWERELLPNLVAGRLVGAIDNGNKFFHDYGTPERYAHLISQPDILARIYGQPL